MTDITIKGSFQTPYTLGKLIKMEQGQMLNLIVMIIQWLHTVTQIWRLVDNSNSHHKAPNILAIRISPNCHIVVGKIFFYA
jgi:hypothetical protein